MVAFGTDADFGPDNRCSLVLQRPPQLFVAVHVPQLRRTFTLDRGCSGILAKDVLTLQINLVLIWASERDLDCMPFRHLCRHFWCRRVWRRWLFTWVTVILPVILVTILLIKAVSLEGASAGIDYYINKLEWTQLAVGSFGRLQQSDFQSFSGHWVCYHFD